VERRPCATRPVYFIEKNYDEKITIEDLANLLLVGRRPFERRFKDATNNAAGVCAMSKD
jgi:transcriptional regulator GlxA family with amidase domain